MLEANTRRLRFFPLLAYLERLTAGAVRLGGVGPVSKEMIRLRNDPSLGFHSADITSVSLRSVPRQADDPLAGSRPLFEVVCTFLGLSGSSSPLPTYLVEEVAQEDPDRPARRELLDLFHHRLLSLLYRLEAKYELTSELTSSFSDPWSHRLFALAGFDTYEQPPAVVLKAWQLLRVLSLLATRKRTAERLEVALEDVLGKHLEGARVHVRQFVGRWVEIDLSRRVRLGRANHRLGHNIVLGGKAYDLAGKIQIEIAPLPSRAYKKLLPDGELLPAVRELVALFIREPLEYTLELGLVESVTQTFRVSGQDPSQLGRDTWLGNKRQSRLSVQGVS